jgi:hypothetical protein
VSGAEAVAEACRCWKDRANGRRFDAIEVFREALEVIKGEDREVVTTDRVEQPALRSRLPELRKELLSIAPYQCRRVYVGKKKE